MSDGRELEGKGAVVTGGSRGIGKASAMALGGQGCRIVLWGRNADELEVAAEEVESSGAEALTVRCDVTDEQEVRRAARESEEFLSYVDILVNSAGVAHSAPAAKETVDDWTRVFDTNVKGTFLCTRSFLATMMEREWGRVVNIASVVGLRGSRYVSTYAASKHAVVGFTQSVAAETAGKGVTVNAICPGFVDTEMTKQSVERIVEKTGMERSEALDAILSQSPERRLIAPEEVAHCVLFLCHPLARNINGEALLIDGGALLA